MASFLADAGLPVTATGFLGGANAEPFVDLFARKGILDRCLRLPGRTRVNVKIVDSVLDQVTNINFPGPAPEPEDLERLGHTLDELAELVGRPLRRQAEVLDAARNLMAAEAIKQTATPMGHDIEVEVHGAEGTTNPLAEETIAAAAEKPAKRSIEGPYKHLLTGVS